MDDKTIKALQTSVRAWRRRALGTYRGKDGPDGCALCKLFYEKDCMGCPVLEATGELECLGSPHHVWAGINNEDASLLRKAAIAEANFLNVLLPTRHRLPNNWVTV